MPAESVVTQGDAVHMLDPRAAHAAEVQLPATVDALMRQVNGLRRSQRRSPVAEQAALGAAAREFAAFLARTGRFAHDADGRQPADRAQQHGYAYCIISENIAYEERRPEFSSDELAGRLFEGWRNSPPHLHNMLEPDVTETGIGLARSAGGRWFAVQLFGLPKSAETIFAITNRTARTVHYRLGDHDLELLPRVTRTHHECGAPTLMIGDGPTATEMTVRSGEAIGVVQGPAGLRVERE
ncbi:MAG: CAP domain-containing protein [Pseudomonadota bacterium]|nr:CAP domain-containing protein [Pseudomonadota bacterium]